jgi:hypothetical protein
MRISKQSVYEGGERGAFREQNQQPQQEQKRDDGDEPRFLPQLQKLEKFSKNEQSRHRDFPDKRFRLQRDDPYSTLAWKPQLRCA